MKQRIVLILVVAFLCAMLYRDGGLLLVLAYNASRWGVIFAWLARVAGEEQGTSVLVYLLRTMAAVLPHLVLEALSYIIGAMAGVFLSKALSKYSASSDAFAQVLGAVLRLSAISGALLVAGAAAEAMLAPALVEMLFR